MNCLPWCKMIMCFYPLYLLLSVIFINLLSIITTISISCQKCLHRKYILRFVLYPFRSFPLHYTGCFSIVFFFLFGQNRKVGTCASFLYTTGIFILFTKALKLPPTHVPSSIPLSTSIVPTTSLTKDLDSTLILVLVHSDYSFTTAVSVSET